MLVYLYSCKEDEASISGKASVCCISGVISRNASVWVEQGIDEVLFLLPFYTGNGMCTWFTLVSASVAFLFLVHLCVAVRVKTNDLFLHVQYCRCINLNNVAKADKRKCSDVKDIQVCSCCFAM